MSKSNDIHNALNSFMRLMNEFLTTLELATFKNVSDLSEILSYPWSFKMISYFSDPQF